MAALYDGDDNRVFTASRKEGKHTYQLFKREEKKKSPYTAPAGEKHSLFWYGFSQNVLQALSTLPQTVGTIWHEIFDDMSTAYHKKVAKDRANEEGLVVSPPSIGELPSEGEVTYSSQVKEVLIPYTTREDRFNYYEERNYVNDINRQHTEMLQTYDRELKGRETYTYGHGRTSYHNHETGDHYNYLTNQSGSVTGLTKEGEAVASTSYSLYGSTTRTTDETGNPFAYNGEARDITGLDYLRARYYDSQAGTFLTEDSYQGQLTNPLSQNRYAYVHNNPINYTDPSGHVASSPFTMFLGGGKPRYSQPRPLINYEDGTLYAPNTPENKAHQIRQQQTGVYSYTYVPTYVPTASAYQYIQQQESQVRAQAHAQAVRYRQQQIRSEYAQATGYYGTPRTREAKNLLRNWGTAFANTLKHVCTTAERVGKQTMKFLKKVDWKKVAIVATATVAAVAVTALTAGAAAPLIAGMMGVTSSALAMGTVGFGTTVAIGVATGAVSGAAGGATYGWLEGNLSGRSSKTITQNTLSGGLNGFVSGGLTGGLGTAVTGSASGIANPFLRYGADTASETVVDTFVDTATGGEVTPASIATNLAINAVSEGVSARTVKGAKADVNISKSTTANNTNSPRPTWKQSEIDVGKQFPDYSNQKSYLDGQEVPYGTKGSVRPEYYGNKHSIEVKNYNLESRNGKYNLVNNVIKQIEQRAQHLPLGSRQTIFVDIRGQNVSDDTLNYVFYSINNKTLVDVEVIFKRD
ncbi:RHS repeat-associated core domain-containing protein [Streptococcus danieliae]|nr:RHS repeat-associated core domain-containing protein [Streptococcus danieliae]